LCRSQPLRLEITEEQKPETQAQKAVPKIRELKTKAQAVTSSRIIVHEGFSFFLFIFPFSPSWICAEDVYLFCLDLQVSPQKRLSGESEGSPAKRVKSLKADQVSLPSAAPISSVTTAQQSLLQTGEGSDPKNMSSLKRGGLLLLFFSLMTCFLVSLTLSFLPSILSAINQLPSRFAVGPLGSSSPTKSASLRDLSAKLSGNSGSPFKQITTPLSDHGSNITTPTTATPTMSTSFTEPTRSLTTPLTFAPKPLVPEKSTSAPAQEPKKQASDLFQELDQLAKEAQKVSAFLKNDRMETTRQDRPLAPFTPPHLTAQASSVAKKPQTPVIASTASVILSLPSHPGAQQPQHSDDLDDSDFLDINTFDNPLTGATSPNMPTTSVASHIFSSPVPPAEKETRVASPSKIVSATGLWPCFFLFLRVGCSILAPFLTAEKQRELSEQADSLNSNPSQASSVEAQERLEEERRLQEEDKKAKAAKALAERKQKIEQEKLEKMRQEEERRKKYELARQVKLKVGTFFGVIIFFKL